MTKKVVLLTYSEDSPSLLHEMTEQLERRGVESLRFDTDLYPLQNHVAFAQEQGSERMVFGNGSGEVALGPEDAVWYRRARYGHKLPFSMDEQLRAVCLEESENLLRGLMAAVPCFVLDPPELVKLCGHKPRQQRLAREVGLETPRTLMTNEVGQAKSFLESCEHGAIAKMLSSFAIYAEDKEEQVVFTTALSDEHLSKLDGLRYCPMVFQERVEKQLELRITVVGNRLFAAAVDSMTMPGAEVDWRQRGVSLIKSWIPYTLPAAVERSLHKYMDAIGMQYSAIDMIVEPSGRHVFLEANPAGEFFWLECNAPCFPLAAAIADVLTDQPGARRRSLARS